MLSLFIPGPTLVSWPDLIAAGWLSLSAVAPGATWQAEDAFVQNVRPLLSASCFECHGGADAAGDEARGNVDFTRYPSAETAQEDPELWALVNELLETQEMPPPGHPRPAAELVAAAIPWLRTMASRTKPAPEPPTLRRLNGREVATTVRDLYGLSLPREEIFGDDPVGHGYDTSAGVQTWNGDSLERYLAAAEYVAQRVFPADRGPRSLGILEQDAIRAGGNRRPRLNSNGKIELQVEIPAAGRWRLRVGAYGEQAGPDPVRVQLLAGKSSSAVMELLAATGTPEVLAFDVDLPAGQVPVGVRFLNDWYRRELKGIEPHDRNLVVQWFEVIGPLGAPEPSQLQAELAKSYGTSGTARATMLAELASAAWRRPVDATEMEPYVALSSGADLSNVLQLGLTAILASPHFYLLTGQGPRQDQESEWTPLSDLALASRLSYFLWSSCPDDALLELAITGQLQDPRVLQKETERMLQDDRSKALADGFALQWLGLSGLMRHRPDKRRFPDFTDALASSMLEETKHLFLDVLHRDAGLRNLLLADWTFVDERLAAHYSMAMPTQDVDALGFARVSLIDRPRRGLLGHASMLTITSDPTRTSPVLRGKWILEKLLGTPPPPPPPGVGSLPENGPRAQGSLRERLEAHRAEPSCATCHAGMDPLGFGLEGFDGIGAVRTGQAKATLDETGELPDGRRFTGLLELVNLLAGEPGLEKHLATELLTYGIGRAVGPADRRALQPFWEGQALDGIGLRSLIAALVQTKPFTHSPPRQP